MTGGESLYNGQMIHLSVPLDITSTIENLPVTYPGRSGSPLRRPRILLFFCNPHSGKREIGIEGSVVQKRSALSSFSILCISSVIFLLLPGMHQRHTLFTPAGD